MAAITISRQYGSGGRKVALEVSKTLGWPLFDKRLMTNVARDLGLSSEDVIDFTEDDYTVTNFWDRFFAYGGFRDPSGTYMVTGADVHSTVSSAQMDEEGAVRLVNKAIQMAYERGNVVVVGRGGQVILKDKPDVFHFRVQAPMGMRQQRLEAYEEIDREDTKHIAEQRDRSASKYMKHFFDVNLENPELYHLVINSEKLDIDAVAQLIVSTTNQFLAVKTP
jgi:CMP/dCMP kinase